MTNTKDFNRLSDEELADIRLKVRQGKGSQSEKLRLIEDMAYHHCQIAEIATMLGVTRQHIETFFREQLNVGHVMLKHDIRRMQLASAKKNVGNCTMLIWLGKQYLEQTETPQMEVKKDQFDEFIEWISSQKTPSSGPAKSK